MMNTVKRTQINHFPFYQKEKCAFESIHIPYETLKYTISKTLLFYEKNKHEIYKCMSEFYLRSAKETKANQELFKLK